METNCSDSLSQVDEDAESSFLLPSKSLRSFTMRKRKRKGEQGDADNISVCSLELDMSIEPDLKKKKSLSRVTSMVLATPGSLSKKVGKMSSAIQRSLSSARLPSPASSLRTPSRSSLARSASTVFGPDQRPDASGRTSPGAVSLPDQSAIFSSPFRRSSVNLSRKGSTSSLTPYRAPGPTPGKVKPTKYWSEVYASSAAKLTKQEVKLQEAVFELYNGEVDLVEDLRLIRKTYADSLIHLNILKPEEEQLVFGKLNDLVPLHASLHLGLKKCQSKEGIWFEVGPAVAEFVKSLKGPYVAYCCNLIQENILAHRLSCHLNRGEKDLAKAFLDKKRDDDKAFCDFLQRCLESPFSRKLDLWSFLDVPRSRLVKYPLLLKQVRKYSEEVDDLTILDACIKHLENVISLVDKAMAESRCASSISNMEFIDEQVPDALVGAKEEILSGVLRNSRGTKVNVLLFDTVLVVGRSVTRPGVGKILQVYRDPIPIKLLECDDLSDGEASKQGSFHRAFSNQSTSRNAFRVSLKSDTESPEGGVSHTLIAPDEHSKRQWLTTIHKAVESAAARPDLATETDAAAAANASRLRSTDTPPVLNRTFKRRSSSGSVAAKLSSPLTSKMSVHTPRTGLFRKHNTRTSPSHRFSKSSPLIKSSLSQSALERLKSGGVKKLRGKGGRQDENKHRGAIVMDGAIHMNRRIKSTTAIPSLLKKRRQQQQPAAAEKKSRVMALIDENTRQRTKSWSHLVVSPGEPRYLTRSAAKISKSMSDLLGL